MQFLIGTGNKGKFIEITEALAGLPLTFVAPEDLRIIETPAEHGTTFEENARHKAQFFHERGKIPTIADDSGITVEALPGALGVQTRRWGLGPTVSDEEWIRHFLEHMSRERNRRASFTAVIAFIDDQGREFFFRGTSTGAITQTLEAPFSKGLPFDGCFKPDGFDKVFSALSLEEKNRTSHRGRALQDLRAFLSSGQYNTSSSPR